jgi:NodT family efflux transporter outer membrane factor (OMF) lipoprotein
MNRRIWFAALLVATLLSSCMVGPRYSKPAVPAAPAYSEAPPASYGDPQAWKAAQPSDHAIRGRWWEIFGDPQLNSLEEQVGPVNETLRAAEANFRQSRASIQFNRSNLYPTVSATAGITRNRISGTNPTGLPSYQYALFSFLPVDVSWEADLWGRIRRTVTAARETTQEAAADLQNAKLELETEVAVDYFEARSLDAEKRLLDDTVTAYAKALQLTQNRFNGGVASRVEVAQAQTQLQQTQAQDTDLGVARADYEHAIAVLTGRVPEGFHLEYKPLGEAPPVIPTGVPSQLLERRPDIASAERRMAAANEQIGINRSAYYPTISLNAQAGFNAGSASNWFTWPSRVWAVGPQATETLFDAGRRRASVLGAEAAYDASVANYRQTTLTAFQEVEDNLSTLRILEQEAATQRQATASARDSLQLSLNRYKGGLVTYLEVITAQSIALTNERTDVDLMRRRMDASVQLIKALGGGWNASQLPNV